MGELDILGQPAVEDLGDVDVEALIDLLALTPLERLQRHEQALKLMIAARAAGEAYYGRTFDVDPTQAGIEGA